MQVQQNISLKNYNSFSIDVAAERFAVFNSIEELQQVLKTNSVQPILMLGGGSNILFTKNVDGLVLKNEVKGIEITGEDADHIYVKTGAGENWHRFVMYCVDNNFAGVENLSLIPGNTGASPIQNIGAYGVEIKDVFHELEAYDLYANKLITFGLEDCSFGYRDSIFKSTHKGRFVICSVTFRLHKKPVYVTTYGAIEQELVKMGIKELSIHAVSQAVIHIRRSKLPDPAEIGNAGSFFKNPEVSSLLFNNLQKKFLAMPGYPLANGNVKIAAGWMIEQCGWKGYRRGDAGCHAKQALVLVNYGNATGNEIYSLSEDILMSVREKFGVVLEREVNVY